MISNAILTSFIKVYNGFHINRLEKHCYTRSQEYSIAQFLAKCPVQDIIACDSPLLPSDTFVLATKDDVNVVDWKKRDTYQQVLGSLNWFNTATRPDLAVVCSLLAGRVTQLISNLRSMQSSWIPQKEPYWRKQLASVVALFTIHLLGVHFACILDSQ